MEVQTLISVLQELAPEMNAGDIISNIGYLAEGVDITKIGICVDPTEQNIYSAAGKGMEVIISYHPWQGEAAELVNQKKIIVIPLHDAWDNAPEGVNLTIARAIGLREVRWVDGIVMGVLETTFRDLMERCQRILDLNVLPYYGELRYPVQRIGIWAGPGFLPYHKKIWETCLQEGCDTIISGEISLLPIRFAAAHQLKLIDLGHSAIARPAIVHLVNILKLRLKTFDCSVELLEDYYSCSFYTKNYFLQQSDSEDSLPLFRLMEREG